jgi:hypothetical protein
MAPLSTKAIIYKDSNTRAFWAPHGLDAWLLGPSKDHYRCHLYYVPETTGYRVSGSAELFPQHCIALTFTPDTLVQELSMELQQTLATMGCKKRTFAIFKKLAKHLNAYVSSTMPPQPNHRVEQGAEQRVMNITSKNFPWNSIGEQRSRDTFRK